MSTSSFDEANIRWKTLMDLEHISLSVLDVDRKNRILHVLFKFSARQQIIMHRHKTLNKLFVIQGEHRFYHPNGAIKEIRPVGTYTVTPASDDPHREGGGLDQDVIVLFTMYGERDPLYEALDDNMNVIAVITFDDVAALYDPPR